MTVESGGTETPGDPTLADVHSPENPGLYRSGDDVIGEQDTSGGTEGIPILLENDDQTPVPRLPDGSPDESGDANGDGSSDQKQSPQHPRTSIEAEEQSLSQIKLNSATIFKDLQLSALTSMQKNMGIGTTARASFYILGVGAVGLMVYFLATRFDPLVETLVNGSVGETAQFVQLIISAFLPALLGLAAATACVIFASIIQSRSNVEYTKALAQIGRLARESPSASSRSLAMTQILEETLANARQALTVQIWISRVFFITGVLLLAVFVISLFFGLSWASGGAVVTSLLAFAAAALLNPQRQIRSDLAKTTQLGAVLAGYTRQAGIVEEQIYAVMKEFERKREPEKASKYVFDGVDELAAMLGSAVKYIDKVQAPEQISARETWLWDQLSLREEQNGLNGAAKRK